MFCWWQSPERHASNSTTLLFFILTINTIFLAALSVFFPLKLFSETWVNVRVLHFVSKPLSWLSWRSSSEGNWEAAASSFILRITWRISAVRTWTGRPLPQLSPRSIQKDDSGFEMRQDKHERCRPQRRPPPHKNLTHWEVKHNTET